MKLDQEVKQELRFIGVGCGVCAALTAIIASLAEGLDLPMLLGCALGWLLSFGNFWFLTVGVVMALETGDEVRAKKIIRSSGVIRAVCMLGVTALTLIFSQYVHWLPVILATFFPRILISARGLWNFLRRSVPVTGNNAEEK